MAIWVCCINKEISLKCDPGHLHRSKGIRKAHGRGAVFPKTSERKATCSEIPAQEDWGLLEPEVLVDKRESCSPTLAFGLDGVMDLPTHSSVPECRSSSYLLPLYTESHPSLPGADHSRVAAFPVLVSNYKEPIARKSSEITAIRTVVFRTHFSFCFTFHAGSVCPAHH